MGRSCYFFLFHFFSFVVFIFVLLFTLMTKAVLHMVMHYAGCTYLCIYLLQNPLRCSLCWQDSFMLVHQEPHSVWLSKARAFMLTM